MKCVAGRNRTIVGLKIALPGVVRSFDVASQSHHSGIEKAS